MATWPQSSLWTGSLAQPQWLILRHDNTTPSWDSRDCMIHCHSSLKTYRHRKAIWRFALACLSCWWVPFDSLESLWMNVTFPLSLPHVPLVMAADVCQDVSPKRMPLPEEVKLDSSKTTRAKIKWFINQRWNFSLAAIGTDSLLSLTGVKQKKIMRLGIKLKGPALAKGLCVHFQLCTQALKCLSTCEAIPCQ